jgi:hypothetical protein
MLAAELAAEAEELVNEDTFETAERAVLDTADESVFPHDWFDKYEATAADLGKILVHGDTDPARYGFEEQITVDGDFESALRTMARFQFLADVIALANYMVGEEDRGDKPSPAE